MEGSNFVKEDALKFNKHVIGNILKRKRQVQVRLEEHEYRSLLKLKKKLHKENPGRSGCALVIGIHNISTPKHSYPNKRNKIHGLFLEGITHLFSFDVHVLSNCLHVVYVSQLCQDGRSGLLSLVTFEEV
ncbi:hypothetical protein CR513_44500, partial [Mucuna pruriens]